MKTVFAFLFRHWRREAAVVWGVALCMSTATIADLWMPVYSGRLVDAITPHNWTRVQALHTAESSLVSLAVLGIILLGARHGALYFHRKLTLRLMARLGSDSFWRVQRFSTDWHANTFAGSVVRRITRGMGAVDLMDNTMLLALLPAMIVLIGATLLLGAHWPSMGLLVGAGAVLYMVLSVNLNLQIVAPAFRLSNKQDTRLGGTLADAITCNAVVKSFGAEEREDEYLARVLGKWQRRTRRAWLFIHRTSTLQLVVLLGLRITVLSYGVFLWWTNRASVGDVAFVLTSYFLVHGYLVNIGQHVANLQRSASEMEEMVEMDSQPLGIVDQPNAPPLQITRGEIVFDEVTFRYGSHSEPLFKDFSLRIRAGERVGLVGHSGSGKTTFVKLLHRLYDIQSGEILVDGRDISAVAQASLRSRIALVPQEPILFHRSLAENIAYARPGASLLEIEAAARLAHAHEFVCKQPKGYGTLVGERGVKLSGGERQRIALARAFLADTPILILDEATSALDSESEALIQEAMERLLVGRTAIVVAHRLSTVRMLDRILVFEDGAVIEDGPHDALVQTMGGTYKRLFERQALGLLVQSSPDEEDLYPETAELLEQMGD